MTNTEVPSTPAGWYPDPAGTPRTRWWDGARWTETYADPKGGTVAYSAPGVLRAPAGTTSSTAWIWILALLPLVEIVSTILTVTNSDFAATMKLLLSDSNAPASDELYSGAVFRTAVSWAIIGVSILMAGLDWHALRTAGVPRPFHWAWSLLTIIGFPIVYLIGRTVVAKRRTGDGLAPLVVYLVLNVISITIAVVAIVPIMIPLLESITP